MCLVGLISFKCPMQGLQPLLIALGLSGAHSGPSLQRLCKFWTRAVGKWIYANSSACTVPAVSLIGNVIRSYFRVWTLSALRILAHFFRVFPFNQG